MNFYRVRLLTLSMLGNAILADAASAQTVVTVAQGFVEPLGVAVDQKGDLFVADSGGTVKEFVAVNGLVVPGSTTTTLAGTFFVPEDVALDSNGNAFVADAGFTITEVLAAGNYTVANKLSSNFQTPTSLTLDSQGNVFLTDAGTKSVKELTAASSYQTVMTVASGFMSPSGIAVDSAGDLFVVDDLSSTIFEIEAVGGSIPASPVIKAIGSGFRGPEGIAIDKSGNLFVTDLGSESVKEITVASGYTNVVTVAGGFDNPVGIAIDSIGNLFVADSRSATIKEILAPTPLVAAVLPESRSVEIGATATIFGTIINSGASMLSNCQIALPPTAPAGLSLSYQTTDPSTNAVSGTVNTPVTIAGNGGSQSFLIAFSGTAAFNQLAMPLTYSCDGVPPVISIPGVNTVALSMSTTPVPDVVAIAATAENNGIAEIPSGATGAFALASVNVGVSAPITVSLDTGSAPVPVTALICQTTPGTGVCLAAPSPSITLTIAANATPFFSVFLQATNTVPLDTSNNRIYVRFRDASGNLHGSTSVAVETE